MATMTTETKFSLYSLIGAYVDEEIYDPEHIAAEILRSVDEEHYREAIETMLPRFIQYVLVDRRKKARRAAEGDTTSSRWASVADNQTSLEILRMSVFAQGRRKLLQECTASDCVDLATQDEARALYHGHQAQRYRKLAAELARRKVETVVQLPVEAIRDIFQS